MFNILTILIHKTPNFLATKQPDYQSPPDEQRGKQPTNQATKQCNQQSQQVTKKQTNQSPINYNTIIIRVYQAHPSDLVSL